MPRLVLLEGTTPRTVAIGLETPVRIGSGADTEVCIEGLPEVSAKIAGESGAFFIEEIEDDVPVQLNDGEVSYERLTDGDVIVIGSLKLVFDESDSYPVPGAASDEAPVDAGQAYEDEESTDVGEQDTTPVEVTPIETETAYAALVITKDGKPVQEVALSKSKVVMGRDEGVDIPLKDPAVSGRHATLTREGSQARLEDLMSSNGTFMNGQNIRRELLRDQDRFLIGPFAILFRSKAAPGDVEESTEDTGGEVTASFTEAGAAPDSAGKLIIIDEDDYGKEFGLTEGETSIGRDPSADVTIDHESLSRRHAIIVYEDGAFFVFDKDSANGVRVNGEEVKQKALRHGDKVRFGLVTTFFVEGSNVYKLPKPGEVEDEPEVEAPKKNVLRLVLFAAIAMVAVGYGFQRFGGDSAPEPVAQVTSMEIPKVKPAALWLREIQDDIELQDWRECIDEASELLKNYPDNPEAKFYLDSCRAERDHMADYMRAGEFYNNLQYDQAIEAYAAIPEDSIYHGTSQVRVGEIREEAAEYYANRAEELFEQRECSDAIRNVGFALLYRPGDEALIQRQLRMEEACTEKVVVRRRVTPKPDLSAIAQQALSGAEAAYNRLDFDAATSELERVIGQGLDASDEATAAASKALPIIKQVARHLREANAAGNADTKNAAFLKAITTERGLSIGKQPVGSAYSSEVASFYAGKAEAAWSQDNAREAWMNAQRALRARPGFPAAKSVADAIDTKLGQMMLTIRLAENDPPYQNKLIDDFLSYAPTSHRDHENAKKILDRNVKIRGGLD